jgi:hypothetical protein
MKSSQINYYMVPYLDNKFKFGKITWSSIIAGLIICLSFELLFSILEIGIGMVNIELNSSGISKLTEESIIWLGFSGVVAMGIGGWFVGVFSQTYCLIRCFYYAIITWGLATLLTVVAVLAIYGAILNNVRYMMLNDNLDSQQTAISSPSINNKYQEEIKQDPITKDTTVNANQQVQRYVRNLGQLYLVIFAAFVFSAMAGVLSSIYGCKSVKKA